MVRSLYNFFGVLPLAGGRIDPFIDGPLAENPTGLATDIIIKARDDGELRPGDD